MNAMIVSLVAIVVLACGYMLFGGWLARKWGVDSKRATPAHERDDGADFTPARPTVLFGHHFASIAGAGAIGGPILAAVFGWAPVLAWLLVGGVFFGALCDFGSLFASIRHKGETLAAVASDALGFSMKRLFGVFAYLVLVLLSAALISMVASSFQVDSGQSELVNARNSSAAAVSVLFTVAALLGGLISHRRRIPAVLRFLLALVVVCASVVLGLRIPGVVSLDHSTWVLLIGGYALVASMAPVWLLLRPRDYLSSYLLIAVIVLALAGVVFAGLSGQGPAVQMPAFTGFVASSAAFDVASGASIVDASGAPIINQAAQGGFLFPALFVTVSCGAISGYHGLVASGTTSRQLDKESHAKPIAFGSMMLECLLAVLALCAVAFVWAKYASGSYSSPAQVFADGLSSMLACIPGLEASRDMGYALFMLAVSTFLLTTLDTATRLARYLFQELWVPSGQSDEDLAGWRKVLANKYVASVITVACGLGLGFSGYSVVWPLFGTANLLLAALALLVVCAWLGFAGKSNKVFYVPMVLTFVIVFAALLLTMQQKVAALIVGGDLVVPGIQLALAAVLLVVAVIFVVKGGGVVFGGANPDSPAGEGPVGVRASEGRAGVRASEDSNGARTSRRSAGVQANGASAGARDRVDARAGGRSEGARVGGGPADARASGRSAGVQTSGASAGTQASGEHLSVRELGRIKRPVRLDESPTESLPRS